MIDMVNHPPHYTQGGIECLDAIEAMTGDGYEGYLRGQVLKYLWRYPFKNGLEDLQKAEFYLKRLIELKEEKQMTEYRPEDFFSAERPAPEPTDILTRIDRLIEEAEAIRDMVKGGKGD